jgi:hypothetical protein
MADDLKKHLKLINSSESVPASGTGSLYDDNSGEQGTGGTGGQTGAIEFRYHDALATPARDDYLPPDEIRRLIIVHRDLHKARVKDQQFAREQRDAKKDGRISTPNYGRSMGLGSGGGGSSQFKKHPISNMAQFSGMDKQVIGLASENESKTNAELKEQLENQLRNRYTNTPKFIPPRPRPPG